MHHIDANKRIEKKLDSKNPASNNEQILETAVAVRPPTIHHENYQN